MAEKKAPTKSKAATGSKAKGKGTGKGKDAKDAKDAKTAKTAKTGEKKPAKADAPATESTPSETTTDKPAERRVKIKPQLDEATIAGLEERRLKKKRTPVFRRQEWFRYKKISRSSWRRPIGIQSKMRRHFGYRPSVVSIGFAGPAAVRGLHPSGFREVLVHNAKDLEALDPKTEAARIAGAVGARKREVIEREAERMKIRVLNPMHIGGDEE